MALLTIRLSDETLLKYGTYQPESPEGAIERQLERFKDLDPGERALTLGVEDLTQLQTALGVQVEKPVDLVRAILKHVGTGVNLSEWQQKRLEQAAGFHKQEPKEFLKSVVGKAVAVALGAN